MPRKARSNKSVVSASAVVLKEKAASSSHPTPMASTSATLAPGSTPQDTTPDPDVEMEVSSPVAVQDNSLGSSGDGQAGVVIEDPHLEGSQEEDSGSGSDEDEHDAHGDHHGLHDDYADDMDHDHPSIQDEDDDEDMDESEMAALRASEALFGFDRAYTRTRGFGASSGEQGTARCPPHHHDG